MADQAWIHPSTVAELHDRAMRAELELELERREAAQLRERLAAVEEIATNLATKVHELQRQLAEAAERIRQLGGGR